MATNTPSSHDAISPSTTLQDGAGSGAADAREADVEATEATPLFSQAGSARPGESHTRRSSAASLLRNIQGDNKRKRRWPSIIALVVLCVIALLIMVLGFFAPQTIKEYAEQAVTFEPTSLSIADFTDDGVKARVQGDFRMDSSRVSKLSVRGFGRFGTWIAGKAESGQASIEVSLPEMGNLILGYAQIPPVVLSIRDGHTTHIDVVADLTPGDTEGIKKLARDFLDGRLGQLRLLGKAKVPIKSGLISVGEQLISRTLVLEETDVPKLPKYNIKRMLLHDIDVPGSKKAVAADAEVIVSNKYPIDIVLPSFAFEVFAPNCKASQDPIPLAYVTSEKLHIEPKEDVRIELAGIVRELDPRFTQTCPERDVSPMDVLVGKYIHGKDAEILVKGARTPADGVPAWISDLISDFTVPIKIPGHEFGELVRNFSLTNVHFGLPDASAPDDSPKSNPSISATIKAIIALPEQINFNVSVKQVRADADVFYKSRKLGKLDLSKWQAAKSKSLPRSQLEGKPGLLLESDIKRAPIIITDDDVFAEVVERLLFGGGPLVLGINADVDVRIETALGLVTVRNVPAEGQVPIKTLGNGINFGTIKPKLWQLQILDTSRKSLTMSALMNFTNPTEYSATVPYADVHISKNGSTLGHATLRNVAIRPGKNVNIPLTAVWNPHGFSGDKGHGVGLELLSQFVSGFNTTITARTHSGSIPNQPNLGRALSKFTFEVPTPQLRVPTGDGGPSDPDGDSPDEGMHFISDATMHLISSTATFTLTSPLHTSTIYITYLNATALYKDEEVGHIDHDQIIAVPPGVPITTPKLPVDWSLGSVGYEAIRKAVGGRLKLSAKATVGLRIGFWEERIWFLGRGIGAHVRL